MAFAVPAEAAAISAGIAIFGFFRLWQGRRRRITSDGDAVDKPPLGANDDV
jgi:hypothetical protein